MNTHSWLITDSCDGEVLKYTRD